VAREVRDTSLGIPVNYELAPPFSTWRRRVMYNFNVSRSEKSLRCGESLKIFRLHNVCEQA
jgi:hypothetical protein